jgi:hypothetical protein
MQMKTKLKIMQGMILLGLFFIMSGCCTPNKISGLNVRLIPQQRDCWCWAATTEMISEYYSHRVVQCQSANYIHGTPPDCCLGCTGNCDCWGWAWGATTAEIKKNWTHWGFDYKYKSDVLSWDSLKIVTAVKCFCGKSPIQAIWWWNGGGGHVVAVYGYAEIGKTQYVSYMNPWPPDCQTNGSVCSSVTGGEDAVTTYSGFVNPPGGAWGDSFYYFRYLGLK